MLNDEMVERLARSIHEHYRETWTAQQASDGELPTASTLAGMEWATLTDESREDNRKQARHIEDKLSEIGFPISVSTNERSRPLTEEDLQPYTEYLAEAEHDRWVRRKIDTGWIYGEPRDDAQKIHPLIKPYNDYSDEHGVEVKGLNDAEKELDREPVKAIPGYLKAAGLEIVKPNTTG